MKVKEIISRIEDVEKCIRFLEELPGKDKIATCWEADLAEDIEKHLYDYCELLENMDVRWNGRPET